MRVRAEKMTNNWTTTCVIHGSLTIDSGGVSIRVWRFFLDFRGESDDTGGF